MAVRKQNWKKAGKDVWNAEKELKALLQQKSN